jgi:hypothetical protein
MKPESTSGASFWSSLWQSKSCCKTEDPANEKSDLTKSNKLSPKRSAACLMLAMGLFVGVDAIAQDPGVGGTVAGFEVDADYKSGFIPPFWNSTNYTPPGLTTGDDWSHGSSGSAVLLQVGGVSVPGITADGSAIWQVDGNWGNKSAVPEMLTFAGTSNKNGDPIGPGMKPYLLQVGGSGPQKNDITNTMLYSKTFNGHIWLFFAAETRSVNGASYLDFEYNQYGVSTEGNHLTGPANDATRDIVNGRTVNDFVLVVNYTGGGNKPIVGVRKWLASGQWSEELPVSELGAFVTTNTQNVDAVAPNKAFAGNGAYSNVTGALQLVEGGIDITALNLQLDQCTPEATVTVKTRSSPSFTAELKDLDVLNFSITPSPMATVAAIPPLCEDTSGTTVFNVSGTYTNGTPVFTATGGTVSNESYVNGVATANVSVTGSGSEIATVYLTVTSPNSSCPVALDSAKISVNPQPDGPTLSIVNPDCETALGTITVVSPANPASPAPAIYEYRNNGGAWQTSAVFNFSGGDGYSIEVRAISDTSCVSQATICPSTGPAASSIREVPKISPTGFIKQEQFSASDAKMAIYPNPATTKSTIEFATKKSGQTTLSIYDVNGHLVEQVYNSYSNAGYVNTIVVDGSKYDAGIYFSRLMQGDQQIESQKFVIQK